MHLMTLNKSDVHKENNKILNLMNTHLIFFFMISIVIF